jgi:single-strand DNA-binding protein
MASVNKVTLIGNVGKDPDIRYLQNGDAVANFSIATTETWKDKSGERKEVTQWHRLVCYRKLAEIVKDYVKSGSSLYIDGKIEYDKYTDKQGVEKYSTNIVVNELRMLSSKKDEPKNESKPNLDEFESDIPF